ncbi:hypothetical protein [Shewanella woodyi]|uniref:hypothetical protein n=1 Tax=Shewanella woodyi TaxID=60961 RepID=UPI0037479119
MLSLVLVIVYGLLVCLGAVAGTCTQGDDARFYASLLYGTPLFLLLILRVAFDKNRILFKRINVVAALLLMTSVSYFWMPLMIDTTIKGHHLCGGDFDSYINGSYALERFIPVLHIFSSLFVLVLTVSKLMAAKGSKLPNC